MLGLSPIELIIIAAIALVFVVGVCGGVVALLIVLVKSRRDDR
ncbi:MAG TPA: hypothetical protein VHZ24_09265 [Pirellulales bacterium]|jgi:hypothetical protein|nr:hypothetical protein [Pirellulales bacterium]